MPTITLTSVRKSYGSGPPAVDDLSLEIPEGSFTCLLGPSGCGKTTTLRMIAGLESLDAGTITVGGRVMDSTRDGVFVPPEKRGMGLVFQNYALWPHLTVVRNVEFGLRVRKVKPAERAERAAAALRMMQIEWAADRYPAQLSGGQQQRVSLARMLAVNPDVLLLDEPLSNLDAQLRLDMRAELKRLHDETGHTIVFVTHDQLEAMTMATHVVVMNKGVVQQMAPPMEVYTRPANTFVARFVGSPPMNLFAVAGTAEPEAAGVGAGAPAGAAAAEGPAAGAPADAAGPDAFARAARDRVLADRPDLVGRLAAVGIRPEALRTLDARLPPPADAFVFDADVATALPTGSSWTVLLTAARTELYQVTYGESGLAPGSTVRCAVRTADLHLFDASGSRLPDTAAAAAPTEENTPTWAS